MIKKKKKMNCLGSGSKDGRAVVAAKKVYPNQVIILLEKIKVQDFPDSMSLNFHIENQTNVQD